MVLLYDHVMCVRTHARSPSLLSLFALDIGASFRLFSSCNTRAVVLIRQVLSLAFCYLLQVDDKDDCCFIFIYYSFAIRFYYFLESVTDSSFPRIYLTKNISAGATIYM